MNVRILFAAVLSLFAFDANAAPEQGGCPTGSVKTGEQEEETATAIIVHPICTCISGYHKTLSGCARDEEMWPAEHRLPELRKAAKEETLKIRRLGFVMSVTGLQTLLTMTGDSDEAEKTLEEMRIHLRHYLDIQEQIESITGDRATAEKNRQERANQLYLKRSGTYSVDPSKGTATGQTHFDLNP